MSTSVASIGALDFEREVLQSDKLTVVDFWAEWCRPCLALAPLLDEVARENPDKVRIVKVNVEQEPAIAQKYGIMSIPSLVFFKGGEVREQTVGSMAKRVLVEKINSHA